MLTAAELEKMEKYFRYSPADENHVAARTLPGVHSQGRLLHPRLGAQPLGAYTEVPDEYQDVVDRLARKHKAAAKAVPAPIIETQPGASFGLVTLGGCDAAVREAIDELAERGLRADYMRVRAFPFDESVERFLSRTPATSSSSRTATASCARCCVETPVAKDKLESILVYGGFPLAPTRGRRHRASVPPPRRWGQPRWRRKTTGAGVMTKKPPVVHPSLRPNQLGLTLRDYEGVDVHPVRRLRARLGHRGHRARLLGAGDCRPTWSASCRASAARPRRRPTSSAGPTASTRRTGACPPSPTGAAAANRQLTYIGISGDGDSLSIGLGQLCHAIRRNVDMLYVIENNGVYGLTKGQFSASADVGSRARRARPTRCARSIR